MTVEYSRHTRAAAVLSLAEENSVISNRDRFTWRRETRWGTWWIWFGICFGKGCWQNYQMECLSSQALRNVGLELQNLSNDQPTLRFFKSSLIRPENGKRHCLQCYSSVYLNAEFWAPLQWDSDLWGRGPRNLPLDKFSKRFQSPWVWAHQSTGIISECGQHYCLTALPPCPSSWSSYGNIPSSKGRPERWWLFEGMMEPKSESWSPCWQDHSEEHLSIDPPLSLVTVKLHHLLWSIPDCSHWRSLPQTSAFLEGDVFGDLGDTVNTSATHYINQVISTTYMIPVASWLWLSDSWHVSSISDDSFWTSALLEVTFKLDSSTRILTPGSHGMSHRRILPHHHSDHNTK